MNWPSLTVRAALACVVALALAATHARAQTETLLAWQLDGRMGDEGSAAATTVSSNLKAGATSTLAPGSGLSARTGAWRTEFPAPNFGHSTLDSSLFWGGWRVDPVASWVNDIPLFSDALLATFTFGNAVMHNTYVEFTLPGPKPLPYSRVEVHGIEFVHMTSTARRHLEHTMVAWQLRSEADNFATEIVRGDLNIDPDQYSQSRTTNEGDRGSWGEIRLNVSNKESLQALTDDHTFRLYGAIPDGIGIGRCSIPTTHYPPGFEETPEEACIASGGFVTGFSSTTATRTPPSSYRLDSARNAFRVRGEVVREAPTVEVQTGSSSADITVTWTEPTTADVAGATHFDVRHRRWMSGSWSDWTEVANVVTATTPAVADGRRDRGPSPARPAPSTSSRCAASTTKARAPGLHPRPSRWWLRVSPFPFPRTRASSRAVKKSRWD